MAKTSVTKTMGPIHFEDLEPHRFEDLVRQLAYDFRVWQSIEATGRGGSDDGFDIRAYERAISVVESEESDSEEETLHPMEGNLWMFQCKREKDIGPKKVGDIVSEGVDAKNPPYGYILAAPANFSKKTYDRFRERLKELRVMEFYLWGKAELEDMLHQPKNDHILFAFFGISLVARRRSRTTEIRSTVANKNRLTKLINERSGINSVLLRDIKDAHYPYTDEYSDFKTRPRWKEYPVAEIHPLGLLVEAERYYAFRDMARKEWDFTRAVDLVIRQSEHGSWNKDEHILRENVVGFWELFPKHHQAVFVTQGLVRFDSMAVVDGVGDPGFNCPHVYVDFDPKSGPFSGFIHYFDIDGNCDEESFDDFKRVKKFPDTFSKPTLGRIHTDKRLHLDPVELDIIKNNYGMHTLYKVDDRNTFLKSRDVIDIDQSQDKEGKLIRIKITNKRVESGKELKDRSKDSYRMTADIQRQIGRELRDDDMITIYEFRRFYDREIDATSDTAT